MGGADSQYYICACAQKTISLFIRAVSPWILQYCNVRNRGTKSVELDKMAKTDMERVGLFSEQGYTTISDPYVPPTGSEYRDIDLTIFNNNNNL